MFCPYSAIECLPDVFCHLSTIIEFAYMKPEENVTIFKIFL